MGVTIREQGLREARDRLARFRRTQVMVRALDRTAAEVVAALRAEAPFRPRGEDFSESAHREVRHLRDSIRTERETGIGRVARVFVSDVPQARYVIDGTRPHPIDPTGFSGRTPQTPWRAARGGQRSVLHFITDGGDEVFTRHVEHPGTRPNPFNVRAWVAVRGRVLEQFVAEARAALR